MKTEKSLLSLVNLLGVDVSAIPALDEVINPPEFCDGLRKAATPPKSTWAETSQNGKGAFVVWCAWQVGLEAKRIKLTIEQLVEESAKMDADAEMPSSTEHEEYSGFSRDAYQDEIQTRLETERAAMDTLVANYEKLVAFVEKHWGLNCADGRNVLTYPFGLTETKRNAASGRMYTVRGWLPIKSEFDLQAAVLVMEKSSNEFRAKEQ